MAEPKEITLNLDKLDTYVDIEELQKLEIPGAVDKFIDDTKHNLESVGVKLTQKQLEELRKQVTVIIKEANLKDGKDPKNG